MSDEITEEKQTAATPRDGILASLKRIAITLVILFVIWAAMTIIGPKLFLQPAEPKPTAVAINEPEAPLPTPTAEPIMDAPATEVAADNAPQIAALAAKIEALENKPAPVAPDVSALELRLAKLETELQSLAQSKSDVATVKDMLDTARSEQRKALASLVLFGQLREAALSGKVYASELNALIANDERLKEPLEKLQPHAATGLMTLEMLQADFARRLHSAFSEPQEQSTLKNNLRKLITVRKVGENVKGNDDEAVLARAEAKLAKGDIVETLKELDSLSAIQKQAFAPWINNAGNWLNARAILENAYSLVTGTAHTQVGQ